MGVATMVHKAFLWLNVLFRYISLYGITSAAAAYYARNKFSTSSQVNIDKLPMNGP